MSKIFKIVKTSDDNLFPRGNQMELFQDVQLVKRIGQGSYGIVALCTDKKGSYFALKQCNISKKQGVPNIMELCLMRQFHHPYISHARRIEILLKEKVPKVRIYQDAAKCDLHSYTQGNIINIDLLRKWSFQLIQAVNLLHRENIVHCDIKSGNILLFANGDIKLTDFSLSFKKWYTEYNHSVCTGTHRPLECLLNENWDEKLDIWSLGCTLFEIAYGKQLFPSQNSAVELNLNKHERKKKIQQALINNIIDFGKTGPIKYNSTNHQQYMINYQRYQIPEVFNRPEYRVFNNLFLSMLYLDPKKRPSASQLLLHPFFTGLMPVPGYISSFVTKTQINYELFCPIFFKWSNESHVHMLAGMIADFLGLDKELLNYNTDRINSSEKKENSIFTPEDLMFGCLVISSKVIYGVPEMVSSYDDEEIVRLEAEILMRTSYLLPIDNINDADLARIEAIINDLKKSLIENIEVSEVRYPGMSDSDSERNSGSCEVSISSETSQDVSPGDLISSGSPKSLLEFGKESIISQDIGTD